ncbi:MAG: ABC transporter ATP-binding protein [Pseudomonadota bacterium]
MAEHDGLPKLTIADVARYGFRILAPDRAFYVLAVIYGVGISLLSLATPISVQMLINTVANTGLAAPLIVLSATLFGLLLFSGLLNALRIHLMEIFGRRFYARMVSEISLRTLYAQNPFFMDQSKGPLFNRYFDIIIIQKNLPLLLTGGFTVLLQAGVGFVVVSLYHPLFLVFNVVLTALIWAVWLLWGPSAIRAAIGLSHSKHAAAGWLEGVGASNGHYKSNRLIRHALRETDRVTGEYVDQHKIYFRRYFAQTVCFLVLYALASAVLLGLGGWLVIQGQLTLGQLVAAELILSVAFFGLTQLGIYLNYFYEVCGSLEELSMFLIEPQEEPSGDYKPLSGPAKLVFDSVRGIARGRPAALNFEIEGGARVMASSESHGVQRLFTDLLKRHVEPAGGFATLAGVDIQAIDALALRQEVTVLDRPTIVEGTIRQYLQLACPESRPEAVMQAVRAVGLERALAELDDGLDAELASTGWPLSLAETMQLKLAGAILGGPRVIVLNQLFDVLEDEVFQAVLDALPDDVTVVYFSNRSDPLCFRSFLHLGRARQTFYSNFEDFADARRRDRSDGPQRVIPGGAGTPLLASER